MMYCMVQLARYLLLLLRSIIYRLLEKFTLLLYFCVANHYQKVFDL